MEIIQMPRRGGKTHALLEWAKQGTKTKSYPFWDRVVLTVHHMEAQRLRTLLRQEMNDPDAYNLVYSIEEWKTAHRGSMPVDVAIDNLDLYLMQQFGSVTVATITEG